MPKEGQQEKYFFVHSTGDNYPSFNDKKKHTSFRNLHVFKGIRE